MYERHVCDKYTDFGLCGRLFLKFQFHIFHKLIHKSPFVGPWSLSHGLIRLKSGEPFGFICITVVLCDSRVEVLPSPLNYRCCCCFSFDYNRALGQTRALNTASSRSAVFSVTAEREVEGEWGRVNK